MVIDAMSRGTDFYMLEGESTDTKPEEGIGYGSRFYELDTGDTYFWNGSAWVEVGSVEA